MNHPDSSRPKLVWIISFCLGAMALLDIGLLSWLLLFEPSGRAVQGVRASLALGDWIVLYGLSAILLASMISLFRMRKRSIPWFIAYIGLGSWGAFWYARTPAIEPYFNEIASLCGLAAVGLVLAYMVRLKIHERLA